MCLPRFLFERHLAEECFELLWASDDDHPRAVRVRSPLPNPTTLSGKTAEMPHHDGFPTKNEPPVFHIPVADGSLIHSSGYRPAQEPPKREPSWIVQSDDKLHASQRDINPFAVRGVQYPLVAITNLLNPPALLLVWNLHPVRLPSELIRLLPRETSPFRKARCQRGFPRPRYPIDQDSTGMKVEGGRFVTSYFFCSQVIPLVPVQLLLDKNSTAPGTPFKYASQKAVVDCWTNNRCSGLSSRPVPKAFRSFSGKIRFASRFTPEIPPNPCVAPSTSWK